MQPSLTLEPIGTIRTPFRDRVSAPRQPAAARGVRGTIELLPGKGFEHALEDLEGWDYVWVLFWFHLNEGWRPKVLPPRSAGKRRGVFSTRSPHRPNPIGMSVLRLESVDGLTVRVADVDLIDGTPILDLKPYVPYTDAIPGARTGWLEPLAPGEGGAASVPDPEPGFDVEFAPLAQAQLAWLAQRGIDLEDGVTAILSLGPQPHPYRRIKKEGPGLRLAHKDWRIRFRVNGRTVTVDQIVTGYRESQLASQGDPALDAHRAFAERFAASASGRPDAPGALRTDREP